MNLGTDTGSLVNYIHGNTVSKTPEVGMGATELRWSDREPLTIHKVEGKKLWASYDKAERIDDNGMSECQEYEYSNENTEDYWMLFTLRKDGRWHKGTTLQGTALRIGQREKYYDFSF